MIELIVAVIALTFAALNHWRSLRKVHNLEREVDALRSRPRPEDVIGRIDAVDEDDYGDSVSGYLYAEDVPGDWPYRIRSASDLEEWCHFHQRFHGGWVCIGPKD